MVQIENEMQYNAIMLRINELLKVVNSSTPMTDPRAIELDILSGLIDEYEDIHYPIEAPSFIDALKETMYDMGLTQKKLAEMLGVSQSRISEYLTGRAEPTLQIAREISKKLGIDADIILGV